MNTITSRMPRLFFLLLLIPLLPSCKKKSGKPEETAAPIVSGKGTPTGPVFEKIIGPAGGSITSEDGAVTITIPAGAVASNTTFGIQPITNTTTSNPAEAGEMAYRFTPEGTTFSKPVEVIRTFTAEQMLGKSPELLTAAFQTAAGTWKAVPGRMNKDTRQYSFKTTHFSDWVVDGLLKLDVPDKTAAPGETVEIMLRGLQLINYGGDDLLAPLVPSASDIQWTLIHRTKGKLVVDPGTLKVAEFTAADLQQPGANNFAEISVKIIGKGLKVLDETLPDKYNSFKEITLLAAIEIMGDTYMKGTFMGVPLDITIVQATGNQGQMGINAVKGDLTISLIVSAEGVGEYPCGSLAASGKADVGVHRSGTPQTAKTYYSYFLECNSSNYKYADAAVTINKWGEAGQPVEGRFQGHVYFYEGNTPEGCPIYKSQLLDIEFRTRRIL